MKKLNLIFIITLIVAVTAILSSTSCRKESYNSEKSYKVTYKIPVYEQENVDYYEIQVSTDGNLWTPMYKIKANTNPEYTYIEVLDLSFFFKNHSRIYTRVRAVDLDLKFQYSQINTIRL